MGNDCGCTVDSLKETDLNVAASELIGQTQGGLFRHGLIFDPLR